MQEYIKIFNGYRHAYGIADWTNAVIDPENGKKNILVICPGFSSDCVETLEEISIQGKESFINNGGKNFDLIPCLNDNEDHINLFEQLIKRYLISK